MNYTLNQLRIYLKVVKTKSITKAAEELHLSQPAVSIQLKNLQEQFEIPLTEVVGRKLYITSFGIEVAHLAERILESVTILDQKTSGQKGHLSGYIKISVVSTGKYVMPYFLGDFLRSHPSVELFMDVTNKAGVVESLERNDVDFSLVSVIPDNLSLDFIRLMQNRLYLVANMERAYTEAQYPTSIFEDWPLIYRESGSATRLAMERFLIDHQIKVGKKLELTSNEAVKQAVLAGLGASIMPLIGLKNELTIKDLQIIQVKGLPITTEWYLVWLKGKQFSPAASAYVEYLQNNKAELINKHFSWLGNF
jgi:DNA-binding transcriptional LysR family regulator